MKTTNTNNTITQEEVYTHCATCNVEFSTPSTWQWCTPCENQLAHDAERAQDDESMEWIEHDMDYDTACSDCHSDEETDGTGLCWSCATGIRL